MLRAGDEGQEGVHVFLPAINHSRVHQLSFVKYVLPSLRLSDKW